MMALRHVARGRGPGLLVFPFCLACLLFLLAVEPQQALAGETAQLVSGADPVAASAPGKEPKNSAKKTAWLSPQPSLKVKILGEVQWVYDDNVFHMAEDDLLAYRQGDAPGTFGMDTYDDFILSPRLTMDLSRKIVGSKETAFRVRYLRWQYTSNHDKTNDQWFLRLRQQLLKADAIELSYAYTPPAYICLASYVPPLSPPAQPPVWIPLKARRQMATLGYSGRLSSRLGYRAEAGYARRSCNEPFLENDSREWSGAGTGTVKLSPAWSFVAKYQHASNVAKARGATPGAQGLSSLGDASFERDLYQGTLGFSPPHGLWKVKRIELMGQRQAYRFRSERPYVDDPAHAGRKDFVNVVELRTATDAVCGPITLEAGWRLTRSTSTWAATVVGGSSLAGDRTYANNRLWLGMAYPF
jgi:hypothetical protein